MKLLEHNEYEELLKIHHLIIEKRLWQSKPLNVSQFSTLLQNFSIWSLSAKKLFNNQIPMLLRADEIIFENKDENLFQEILCTDNYTRYQDDQSKSFIKSTTEINYQAFYHPYRTFVLNNVFAEKRLNIVNTQLLNPEGFVNLAKHHKNDIERYLSTQINNTIEYSDQITTLCIICETLFHSIIADGHYCLTYPYSINSPNEMFKEIKQVREYLKALFVKIGFEKLVELRDSLSIHIDRADPNRSIHTIIRLIERNERKRVQGALGLSILFSEMAESLRRAIEYAFDIELEEEENLQGRGTFKSYKEETLGTSRVMDDWQTRNLYLRQKGIVYGLKTKLYVEGETEFFFFKEEFRHISSIEIVNLKGNVVQKNGKGVSFRDSLRSDIEKHIFSFVIMDNDVKDNYRALEKSVKDNEFFGQYYLCSPDFEVGNFSPDEMHQLFINENEISNSRTSEFENLKCTIQSGSKFFKVMSDIYPEYRNYDKGKTWGIALHNFSNSKSTIDRLVDDLIQSVYRSLRWDYMDFRNRFMVSSEGKLIDKV